MTGPERESLRAIWDGANLAAHRRRLEEGKFDFGCQECELAIKQGGRSSSLASHFDRWQTSEPWRYPRMLDFALSSRCNLQCVMCNGELSSAIRTQREGRPPMKGAYDDEFFDELTEFLPHAQRLQFKGGEPFLAPENERVWSWLIENGHRCEVAVTTNATVWNSRVERLVRELRMELNISIDGMSPEVYEGIRPGADFGAVWSNVERFQSAARMAGGSVTISFCFMPQNWHELPAFLSEADRRSVNAYVILVNQPDEYDVLKMPLDEVALILESLERSAPTLESPALVAEWQRVTDRLHAHLRDPIPLKVEVSPAVTGVSISVRPLVSEAEVRAGLAAVSDTPPLVVKVSDGSVVSAEGPSWAASLEPDRWPGTAESAMVDRMVELVGAQPAVEPLDQPLPGVEAVEVRWGASAGLPHLLVWTFVPPDDDPCRPAAAGRSSTVWMIVPLPAREDRS